MERKETSDKSFGLATLLTLVTTIAGGLWGIFSSGIYFWGTIYGLALGLLIGLSVLLTVEYAAAKTRRN